MDKFEDKIDDIKLIKILVIVYHIMIYQKLYLNKLTKNSNINFYIIILKFIFLFIYKLYCFLFCYKIIFI